MTNNPRVAAFRAVIKQFIDDRKTAKQKNNDHEDATLTAKYEYGTWLADAARRVNQLQAVTHVLKATHPDAQGSSLYVRPESLPRRVEIGTHTLGPDYAKDIIGNAAALDVYKFLKQEVGNSQLLDWFLQDDADLLAALHDDETIAREWSAAFKTLFRTDPVLSAHEKAKQIYWCITGSPADNTNFHLLEPLFPSALAHAIHTEIDDARFGEKNKATRDAKRNKLAHDDTYRDYRRIAVRKFGGSKPHNVSQLNSERHGKNYLFESLPPAWNDEYRSLLGKESVFPLLRNDPEIRRLLDKLRNFLKTNPPATMETRKKRERIEQALGGALVDFAAEIQCEHPPGWTRDENCKLPQWACLWLDPERVDLPFRPEHAAEDEAFRQDFEWKNWPDEVATGFAYWVNSHMEKAGLEVGDTELKHWAKQAIVEVDWPAPMQRRFRAQTTAEARHD